MLYALLSPSDQEAQVESRLLLLLQSCVSGTSIANEPVNNLPVAK